HRRDTEARLQMHLVSSAARVRVKRRNRLLRPAMAFREQGHCQKDRCGGRGESDAQGTIAVGAKAPFQGRANVVEMGARRRSFVPLDLNSLEQAAVVLDMPSAEIIQVTALGQLRERVGPRRLEQPKMSAIVADA